MRQIADLRCASGFSLHRQLQLQLVSGSQHADRDLAAAHSFLREGAEQIALGRMSRLSIDVYYHIVLLETGLFSGYVIPKLAEAIDAQSQIGIGQLERLALLRRRVLEHHSTT